MKQGMKHFYIRGLLSMEIRILEEHGYDAALIGLSLSYYREGTDFNSWWDAAKQNKAAKQLATLAFKGGGHNKALESINVWFLMTATRGFYQEFDTYRVGITKNSASSMHTLAKEMTTKANFAPGTSSQAISAFNRCLYEYTDISSPYFKDITRLKNNLPEGYLQTRQVCVNYMTLQNIVRQRQGHRLRSWDAFIVSLLEQLEHPELIIEPENA